MSTHQPRSPTPRSAKPPLLDASGKTLDDSRRTGTGSHDNVLPSIATVLVRSIRGGLKGVLKAADLHACDAPGPPNHRVSCGKASYKNPSIAVDVPRLTGHMPRRRCDHERWYIVVLLFQQEERRCRKTNDEAVSLAT